MVNVINLLDDFSEVVAKLNVCLKPNGVYAIVQWDTEKLDPELLDWEAEDRDQFTMRATLRQIYDSKMEVIRIEHFLPVQNIYFCQPTDAE